MHALHGELLCIVCIQHEIKNEGWLRITYHWLAPGRSRAAVYLRFLRVHTPGNGLFSTKNWYLLQVDKDIISLKSKLRSVCTVGATKLQQTP